MHIPENLRDKHAEEKDHGAKREIPLNQRDYEKFSVLYYICNSLGFDPLT